MQIHSSRLNIPVLLAQPKATPGKCPNSVAESTDSFTFSSNWTSHDRASSAALLGLGGLLGGAMLATSASLIGVGLGLPEAGLLVGIGSTMLGGCALGAVYGFKNPV